MFILYIFEQDLPPKKNPFQYLHIIMAQHYGPPPDLKNWNKDAVGIALYASAGEGRIRRRYLVLLYSALDLFWFLTSLVHNQLIAQELNKNTCFSIDSCCITRMYLIHLFYEASNKTSLAGRVREQIVWFYCLSWFGWDGLRVTQWELPYWLCLSCPNRNLSEEFESPM